VQQRSTKRRGHRDFAGDAAFECANATAGISARPCPMSSIIVGSNSGVL
jgi:hypothetical protein